MKPLTPEEHAILRKDDKLLNKKYRKEHPQEWAEHVANIDYIRNLRNRRRTEISRACVIVDAQDFLNALDYYERLNPRKVIKI